MLVTAGGAAGAGLKPSDNAEWVTTKALLVASFATI
jgi:hypothetical protein